jgi:hypothetical protein
MIRMSRGGQFVHMLLAAAVILAVGCCGSGPSHKCDLSPAPTTPDAGPDAPVACGADVCNPPQVCCLKKSPLVALCVDFQNFEKDGCEKPPEMSCLTPSECQGGLPCCLDVRRVDHPTVTCRPPILCPTDGKTLYFTCTGPQDCPNGEPCTFVGGGPDGVELRVCGEFSALSMSLSP